jgi:hypothetical protein
VTAADQCAEHVLLMPAAPAELLGRCEKFETCSQSALFLANQPILTYA